MDVKTNMMAGHGQVSFGSGQGQRAGCCEHGDELQGSMKREKYSAWQN
jgi:hypothetical protein